MLACEKRQGDTDVDFMQALWLQHSKIGVDSIVKTKKSIVNYFCLQVAASIFVVCEFHCKCGCGDNK